MQALQSIALMDSDDEEAALLAACGASPVPESGRSKQQDRPSKRAKAAEDSDFEVRHSLCVCVCVLVEGARERRILQDDPC